MKTFLFNEANGNVSITMSEETFEDAIEKLKDLGLDPDQFECEDEEGEDED